MWDEKEQYKKVLEKTTYWFVLGLEKFIRYLFIWLMYVLFLVVMKDELLIVFQKIVDFLMTRYRE